MAKTKTLFIVLIILLVIAVILAVISCFIKKPKSEEVVIADKLRGFAGEIKEIQGRVLSVEAKIPLADPAEEPIKKIIKVVVADNAKILKLEFPEKITAGSTKPVFPKETEINFNELKVGDKIDARTKEYISEKIKNNEEILADTINVVE